jgi:hypothetical protein
MYEAAQAIEKLDPEEVLSGVANIVRTVMNPQKFSLFVLEGDRLRAAMEDGWSSGDVYQRTFPSSSALFQRIVGRQRILCAANEEDEQLLEDQGVLAGPLLRQERGTVLGMLKIEQLGFLDLNFAGVQNFKILCEWIATAYGKALRFQEAERDRVLDSETQLYSHAFLPRQTEYVSVLARRLGFDLSVVTLRLENRDDLSPDEQAEMPPLLRETVGSVLRRTDLAFHREESGAEYALLLPGTPAERASVVIEKLRSGLAERLKGGLVRARFQFSIQEVHQYPRPRPFQEKLLDRQTRFLADLAHRFGFDLSLLVLRVANVNEVVDEDRKILPGAINLGLSDLLPATTPAFAFQREDWRYPVLLPSVPLDEAQRLGDSLTGWLNDYMRGQKSRAQLAVTVQSLEVARAAREPVSLLMHA